MNTVEIQGSAVIVNGNRIDVGSRVLDAKAGNTFVLVLLDPDSYVGDPQYRKKRREGAPAVRNLRAFSLTGTALWDAELPEDADYYHRIVSAEPIDVDSFSSFRCRINPQNGRILSRQFLK